VRQALRIAALLFSTQAAGAARLFGADYAIDVEKSRVSFSVPVMGISKVKGTFADYDILLHAGKARDLSQASVTAVIRMASVQTGKPDWDVKLRSPDWFDAGKHPEITFRSRRVRNAGDHWEASGPILLHGVAREISLPFSIKGRFDDPGADPSLEIHASTVLDRREFGMAWKDNSEAKLVGNKVTVEISLSVRRVAVPAPKKKT
jgi:polyisoprenoid-binding protein YceI